MYTYMYDCIMLWILIWAERKIYFHQTMNIDRTKIVLHILYFIKTVYHLYNIQYYRYKTYDCNTAQIFLVSRQFIYFFYTFDNSICEC